MAKKKAARKKVANKRAARKWKKSSPELIDAFARALENLPENAIEHRKMFGCPCAFVNGNLCCGLHEENGIVRLGEPEREAAIAKHGAGYFEPSGRRMREYVALPHAITDNQRKFNNWVAKSFAYTGSLPPKEKKK